MNFYRIILLTVVAMLVFALPYKANAQTSRGANFMGVNVESITVEGGPIATKHFQSEDEDFRERHALAVVKVHTEGYGNWGLYFLNPNSVERTSVGLGYVTNPYSIPIGPTTLELSGALGLVSGYQDYPVPLVAAQARLALYESKNKRWNAGIAAAVSPYFVEDEVTGDNEFGLVTTLPFLSVRYQF